MSNTSLIIGESGTGKSTSLTNLDPKETFIINVLDKPLPFRGYQKKIMSASILTDQKGIITPRMITIKLCASLNW